jgi:hypothetical protein
MEKIGYTLKVSNLENIFIDKDFISWKEELTIAKVEIDFCQNLFVSILKDVGTSYKLKYQNIIEKLALLKKVTIQIEKELLALGIQLEGYVECQDLQCDTYYIHMHFAFRDRIEHHFSVFNSLKKKILITINKEKK